MRSLIIAASLTLFAAPALAQGPGGPGGPGGLRGLDANQDGQISLEERDAGVKTRFEAIDTDKNGALTDGEFKAAREQMMARMAERRPEGAPGPGGGGRGGPAGGPGGSPLQFLDTDSNGSVSFEEFKAPTVTMFERADADANGVVTREEMQAIAGQRGGGQGPRGPRPPAPPAPPAPQ